MAKLYFRYGSMNSSKSANLLMVAHNYEEQGKNVVILKPAIDTRSTKGKVESRVGISHDAIEIDRNTDIYMIIYNILHKQEIHCVLIDEANFLTKKQVEDLVYIVDDLDIPVIAYGLKNSSVKGKLFSGSEALLYYADSIEEVKSTCQYCNKKATMILRIENGKPVYNGEIIKIGDVKEDDAYYISVCRKHYFNPELHTK